MSRKWSYGRAVAAGLLLTVFFLAGCNELELKSAWRDREIVIDGDATDWRGLTTYVEEGNIAVGVTNDAEDVFVCLHSPTSDVAGQIIMRGLTVWFDPEGGLDETFGIHCPMGGGQMPMGGGQIPRGGGRMSMGEGQMPERGSSEATDRGAKRDPRENKDMIVEMVDEAANRVELLGPDGAVYGTFAPGDIEGLEIALGYADDRIIYELKLPLEKTEGRLYALGVNWEKKVGIRFVTAEIDMDAMREEMGESMGDRPPGGGGGPGGGPGAGRRRDPGGGMPGGGGGPPGSQGSASGSIELKCRAELALPSE